MEVVITRKWKDGRQRQEMALKQAVGRTDGKPGLSLETEQFVAK